MSTESKPAEEDRLRVPVVVAVMKTTVDDNGVFVLARVEAPTIGVDQAFLVLDMRSGDVALTAACGCRVTVPLVGMLRDLATVLSSGHNAPTGGTQVH